MAKTNWQMGDTVQPADLNQIGQEINENTTDVQTVTTELTTHMADYVKHPAFAVATGLANNYVVTLNPAPTAYVDGMGIVLAVNVDSTGTSTLNVNGLGAKPLKKANGTDATNLKANGVYTFRYRASTGNFILQGEGGEYGDATASDVLSGKTIGTENGIVTGTIPIRSGHVNAQSISRSGTTLRLRPPQGYVPGDTGNSIQRNDPNWIADNIRQGVSIFGLTGNLNPFLLQTGSGQISVNGNSGHTISPNIDFRPKLVFIRTFSGNIYSGFAISHRDLSPTQSSANLASDYSRNADGGFLYVTSAYISSMRDNGFTASVINLTSGTRDISWYWFAIG